MAEKNKIFDDLKNLTSGINKENQLFKEFLNFLETEKSDQSNLDRKIIYFESDFYSDIPEINEPYKLAAADTNQKLHSNQKSHSNQMSGFLISKDKSFALKYSYVKNYDLQVSLLTSENIIEHNFILFSRKLDKYFISDKLGNFSIGKYENFNLSEFDFAAIEPFDILQLVRLNNETVVISEKKSDYNLLPNDNFLSLTPLAGLKINSCVLVTNKTKDTLNIKDGSVEIPIILLEDKSLLYLY